MLDEAKSARERVLGDLVRRRVAAERRRSRRCAPAATICSTRTARSSARSSTRPKRSRRSRRAPRSSASASSNEPIDIAAEIAAEIEKLDGADVRPSSSTRPASRRDRSPATTIGEPTSQLVPATAAAPTPRPRSPTALADVDTLFARLRAGHDDRAAAGRRPAAGEAEADRRVRGDGRATGAPAARRRVRAAASGGRERAEGDRSAAGRPC